MDTIKTLRDERDGLLIMLAGLQRENERLQAELAERFTLDDLNAAYERLRANAIRWGVDTGTLWMLAGFQEDLTRILAGEWTEDQPTAALDNVEPAGGDGISPF